MPEVDPLALDVIGSAIKGAGSGSITLLTGWVQTETSTQYHANAPAGSRRFVDVQLAAGGRVSHMPMLKALADRLGPKPVDRRVRVLIARMKNQEMVVLDQIA
jgi:hypothetical protein